MGIRGVIKMEYNEKSKNRLKKIEGQVRGVLNMMEKEKDCKEVVSQLAAIRTAIDRTIGQIVSENLEHCVIENLRKDRDTIESVQQAVELLMKSR